MKHHTFIIAATALATLAIPAAAQAQKPVAAQTAVPATPATLADSTVTAVKIKMLKERKERLKKQIGTEDRKRGLTREGVAPERNEQINDRQDSLCLDLRSQLCEVDLQLKELQPVSTAAIALQYSRIRQTNAASATPEKPAKPTGNGSPSQTGKPAKTRKKAATK